MNGNEIFKTLLEEANKENERQAGKIIGKIIAEAKEEVIPAKPYHGLTPEEVVRTAVAEIINEEREEDSTEPILGRENSGDRLAMRLARVKTINDMSLETWKRVYKYY